ncbi:MAG TPA: hypothetical protein ENK73_03740 [Thiomicrospira sp.]|nr:hypothetical protein [Thiomicrospira sp.]
MEIFKQKNWKTKFAAYVVSFIVIGASSVSAETNVYKTDIAELYTGVQVNASAYRIKGVEFAMPKSGTNNWHVGLSVAKDSFIVNTVNQSRSFVLYFRTNL